MSMNPKFNMADPNLRETMRLPRYLMMIRVAKLEELATAVDEFMADESGDKKDKLKKVLDEAKKQKDELCCRQRPSWPPSAAVKSPDNP